MYNDGQLKIKGKGAPGNGNLFEIWSQNNQPVFTVAESGAITFLHNFTGGGNAHMSSSIVAGSNSLYVGSTRLSYSHTEHRMLLHRLKSNHIPVYLQGRGFTTNDMPDAHAENDMSVFKWIVHARDHFSETLDVHDVFPIANADWDQVDAPTDALDAAFVGMDADITTLESEMDAAEASIALKANLAGPTFTGVPAAPTAAVGTDTTQIATTAFVQDQIEEIVGAAPTALNTLQELAAALDDDASYASTITTALAAKAPKDNPTFTTNVTTPLIHTSQIMSQNAHLKIGSTHTNDCNFFLNSGSGTAETLQISRSGTEVRYQAHGGTGQHRFMNKVFGNGDIDIASGKSYQISGSNIFESPTFTGTVAGVSKHGGSLERRQHGRHREACLDRSADGPRPQGPHREPHVYRHSCRGF